MAHIYPCIGMLTHDLPALREPAIEYFLSFWQEIRSLRFGPFDGSHWRILRRAQNVHFRRWLSVCCSLVAA